MRIKPLLASLCALTVLTASAFGTIAFLTDREAVTNTFTVGNVDITVEETEVTPDGKIEYDTDGDGEPDYIVDPETDDVTTPDGAPADNVTYNETDDTITVDSGEPVSPSTTTGNEYHLIPGESYLKDPTMTITAGSEEAYVRMIVTISHKTELDAIFNRINNTTDGFKPDDILGGLDTANWLLENVTGTNNGNGTYSYEYRYKDTVDGNSGELPALFTSFEVNDKMTGDDLKSIAEFTLKVEGQAIQAATFATEDAAWDAFDDQHPSANP